MALSSVPRFQCILTNDPEKAAGDPLWFEQEEGKKSSFLLELDDAAGIQEPAHVILQTGDSFLFGGLEFESNARNVEIYLTENNKETYLTTSRGLLVSGDNAFRFKCIVVCPGGPRAVTRVHLKLLSLKPASCTFATLNLMKLKGRVPPPEQGKSNTQKTSAPSAMSSNRSTDMAKPGLTQADMGAAMTGVSMLMRSVESSLLESVKVSLDKVEKRLGARLDRIEQYLIMQQQSALLQQQQQQRCFQDMQNEMMLQMKQYQSEMTSHIASLRAPVTKPNEYDDACGAELPGSNEVNSEERQSGSKTESTRILHKREGKESSKGDASMPPDSESQEVEHSAESLTMLPMECSEDQDVVCNVGASENQEDDVVEALIDDLEKGGALISAEVQSSSVPSSAEGQSNPAVGLAKECNRTKERDGDQPEISHQKIHEAASILELETMEEESAAIETVELLDERIGANNPCETEFQDDTDATPVANEPSPEQEEAIVEKEDSTVGTGRDGLDATEEYDDDSRDRRDAGVGTEDAIVIVQANESTADVEASSHTPERRPVMEKRDDAVEIPDLLAD